MLRYLVRRLVALVPTFLLASVIVFSAIRLIPGDTIDMMMSQNDISASVKTREDLIKALGLDQPVLVQSILALDQLNCAPRRFRSLALDGRERH